MVKKLYYVETRKVIVKSWEYEFEADKEFKNTQEIVDWIHANGIKGRELYIEDEDEVEEQVSWTDFDLIEEKP